MELKSNGSSYKVSVHNISLRPKSFVLNIINVFYIQRNENESNF